MKTTRVTGGTGRSIDGVSDTQGRWDVVRVSAGLHLAKIGTLYRCDLNAGEVILQLPPANAAASGGRIGLSITGGGPDSIVTLRPDGQDLIQGVSGDEPIGAIVWLGLVIVAAPGDWWLESGGPILS